MTRPDFGFLRVATAVPRVSTGDSHANVAEMLALLQKAADKKVQLLAFPELCVTSYTSKDLFRQSAHQAEILRAFRTFLDSSVEMETVVIVGLPLSVNSALYNVAAICHRGRVLALVPKQYLPTYGEFEERRWFTPGNQLQETTTTLFGCEVPIGTDILLQIDNLNCKVGVEICEDGWMPIPPSAHQALAGASVIANLSASNALAGKSVYRHTMVAQRSADQICAYIYVSAGCGESTADTVFDGDALVAENGIVLATSERYQLDSQLVMTDVDLNNLEHDRLRQGTFHDNAAAEKRPFRTVHCTVPELGLNHPNELIRSIDANPFVPGDPATLNERCAEIVNIQSISLKERLGRLEKVVKKQVTIGVSGGLDSALALLVIVRAFDLLGWSRSNIKAMTLPGFGTSTRTLSNSHQLCEALGVPLEERSISDSATSALRAMGHEPCGKCLQCENMQARIRTALLMTAGFMVGTGDLSEAALGWCTYGGDQLSMYNVNASVPKTLVRFLIRWIADHGELGETASATLQDILATPISPELIQNNTGDASQTTQLTEEQVGPYELVDFFLYHMIRFGAEPKKIVFLACKAFTGKYSATTIRQWLQRFIVRFFQNQFKRNANPDGPKVGTVVLGQRGDWRMPSDATASDWLQQLTEETPDW